MTDQPKGECPVCSRAFQLRKDGTLRLHSSPFHLAGGGVPPNCRGAGQQPTTNQGAQK